MKNLTGSINSGAFTKYLQTSSNYYNSHYLNHASSNEVLITEPCIDSLPTASPTFYPTQSHEVLNHQVSVKRLSASRGSSFQIVGFIFTIIIFIVMFVCYCFYSQRSGRKKTRAKLLAARDAKRLKSLQNFQLQSAVQLARSSPVVSVKHKSGSLLLRHESKSSHKDIKEGVPAYEVIYSDNNLEKKVISPSHGSASIIEHLTPRRLPQRESGHKSIKKSPGEGTALLVNRISSPIVRTVGAKTLPDNDWTTLQPFDDSATMEGVNDIVFTDSSTSDITQDKHKEPNESDSIIIGQGSFGVVIQAQWTSATMEKCYSIKGIEKKEKKKVAVKVISHALSGSLSMTDEEQEKEQQKLVSMVTEEVRMLLMIEEKITYKDCVVKCYGMVNGKLPKYLSSALRVANNVEAVGILMKYEEGGSLGSFINGRGRKNKDSNVTQPSLSLQEKLRLLKGIARGLAELHSIGVVHADIKPDNVLLSGDNPPEVRLADFGLSKLRSDTLIGVSTLALTNQGGGTPVYSAPEQ
jgi:hypothetical protein